MFGTDHAQSGEKAGKKEEEEEGGEGGSLVSLSPIRGSALGLYQAKGQGKKRHRWQCLFLPGRCAGKVGGCPAFQAGPPAITLGHASRAGEASKVWRGVQGSGWRTGLLGEEPLRQRSKAVLAFLLLGAVPW